MSVAQKQLESETQVRIQEPDFDWIIYSQLYDDLKGFKTEEDCYRHWLRHGKREKRVASLSGIYEKFEIDPTDFPADFDWQNYVDFNPDLKNKITNEWKAIFHYCQVGMKENRKFKIGYLQTSDLEKPETALQDSKTNDKDSFNWEIAFQPNAITENSSHEEVAQDDLNRYKRIRDSAHRTKLSPVFSIIMPIYDRTQLLRESLTSLLNQSYSDFELLLVLDGSPDATRAVVKEFSERDQRIRVFSYADSSGNACRGRNRGIIEARGEYVALSDSDDISTPDRLEVSLRTFQENSCDAVAGKARYIIMEGRKNSPVKMLSENEVFPLIYPILKRVNPIVTSTISIRRDVLLKHGGFRREMVYREDHELWLRLAHRGCKMTFVEHLFGLYRLHDDNNELNFKEQDTHWAEMMHKYYKLPFVDWNI